MSNRNKLIEELEELLPSKGFLGKETGITKTLRQAAQMLREDGTGEALKKLLKQLEGAIKEKDKAQANADQFEFERDKQAQEITSLKEELEEARGMLHEFLDAHREESKTGLVEARAKRCNLVVTHAWLEHVRQALIPKKDNGQA